MEYLFSNSRMRNVSDIQTIKLALWEANGVVSIFRYPEYEAVSRLDLKVAGKISSFFCISKGWRIQKDVLALLGKQKLGRENF